MENVSRERSYLRARKERRKMSQRNDRDSQARTQRKKKRKIDVVSGTEVVVQDENVTNDP